MRNLTSLDTIQIETCNVCRLSCSSCTRFCPQIKNPYFMEFKDFQRAIDSMVGYERMIGFQGGDPLLHPDFEKMCKYAAKKINATQLGLWTTLPKGKEKYAKIICETFYHIFVNDHSRADIFHAPPLVAIQEVEPDRNKMWAMINDCWVPNSWSASINPRGAWFCEIAASMAMLYEEGEGWPVEPGWWWRAPKDFTSQIEQFCPRCGFAAPLALRSSIEEIDDISPLNYEALKDKVRHPERFKIHNLKCVRSNPPMAAYKELSYRNNIAARYGMFLVVNEMGFWTPYLKEGGEPVKPKKSIFQTLNERYGA